jgi:nickel-dependent lactate racemase
MAEPVFLVNATLDHRKAITGFFVGRMEDAHNKGCEVASKTRMVDLPEETDIVIASSGGFPGDINLYQSVKGMSAASNAVKQGGTIILAAECRDGIPDGGEYCHLLGSDSDLETLMHDIRTSHTHHSETWQVQVQAKSCQKATVLVHSDHLTREELGRAHLGFAEDIGTVAGGLIDRCGAGVRVCIMPYGPLIVPRTSKSPAARLSATK